MDWVCFTGQGRRVGVVRISLRLHAPRRGLLPLMCLSERLRISCADLAKIGFCKALVRKASEIRT